MRQGDRLVWLGDPREGLEGKDGVLAVVDCHASMLVLGEPAEHCGKSFKAFGAGDNTKTPAGTLIERIELAREATFNLGATRTAGLEWRLSDGDA